MSRYPRKIKRQEGPELQRICRHIEQEEKAVLQPAVGRGLIKTYANWRGARDRQSRSADLCSYRQLDISTLLEVGGFIETHLRGHAQSEQRTPSGEQFDRAGRGLCGSHLTGAAGAKSRFGSPPIEHPAPVASAHQRSRFHLLATPQELSSIMAEVPSTEPSSRITA
jgi:hypothetical protein